MLILWMMIELLDNEIKNLKGGSFNILVFVGVIIVAMVREILISTLRHDDLKTQAFLTVTLLVLGVVYYLVSRAQKLQGVILHHILLGIREGWRRRRELRTLLRETPPGAVCWRSCRSELGAPVVFASWPLILTGCWRPMVEISRCLTLKPGCVRRVAVCGAERMFILSNRPEGPRVTWFHHHLPGVRFISGVRKKPYCDGL